MTISLVTKVLPHFPQQVYAVRLCWEGRIVINIGVAKPSTVTGLLNAQS
jgi:hypothetical protein